MIALDVLEVLRPARIGGQDLALLEHQTAEFVQAELFDQELHARTAAIALLAQTRKYATGGLRERQNLLFRHRGVEQLGIVGHGAQTAADHHLEAAARDAVALPGLGDEAQIMNIGQAAAAGLAAGEGDLELSAHVLGVGVAQQVIGHGLGVGRGIEGLAAAHAGERAGGDVAHRIAAGLAGGDADGGQPPHEVGRIVDVDVVQLHVLARGDVADGVRVLLGHIGETSIWSAFRPPNGILMRCMPGASHTVSTPLVAGVGKQAALAQAIVPLAVVITLAIGAAAQPGLGEQLVLDLALLLELDLAFEHVDLTRELGRHPIGEPLFPARRGCGLASDGAARSSTGCLLDAVGPVHAATVMSRWGPINEAAVMINRRPCYIRPPRAPLRLNRNSANRGRSR